METEKETDRKRDRQADRDTETERNRQSQPGFAVDIRSREQSWGLSP